MAATTRVCDNADHCTTGKVEGINIDRTTPKVSVGGVTDGGSYTLGTAPTPTCTASDDVSGLSAPCTGTLVGGNANGVGEFIYTASAIDKAGNHGVKTAHYRVVYRVDGFSQPINDPAVSPGAPMSVFKSGSTVPVKFQVKRDDGQLVTPLAAPTWVLPVKGVLSVTSVAVE